MSPAFVVLMARAGKLKYAAANPWLDPCGIRVAPPTQQFNEAKFKQMIAHEFAHCVESASFPAPYEIPSEIRRWWVEGLADYMSNVVYEDTDFEHRTIKYLQLERLAVPVPDRSYQNFIFFQFLANEIGHDAIAALVQTLTTEDQVSHLTAIDGMLELHHEFAKAMTDREIRDTNGSVIPYEMTPQNRPKIDIATTGPIVDFLDPFGVRRYHLVLDLDRVADLEIGVEGDVFEESRPIQGGRWQQVPVTLPDRCSESVIVLTPAQHDTSYSLKVLDIREAPGQCQLEGTWLVDNDSLNVWSGGFETEYVKGEIRGTFNEDGTVDVVYDNWEYQVTRTIQRTGTGACEEFESYDEITYTFNVQGSTTYEATDRMRFEAWQEVEYLEGTGTSRYIITSSVSGGLAGHDETTENKQYRNVFSGNPKYELDGSTLRFLGEFGDEDIILHRVGDGTP